MYDAAIPTKKDTVYSWHNDMSEMDPSSIASPIITPVRGHLPSLCVFELGTIGYTVPKTSAHRTTSQSATLLCPGVIQTG
jgi:hypothetical protein